MRIKKNGQAMRCALYLIYFALPLMLLSSCRNDKNYYYTPTIGAEVHGGTTGGSNDPISTSSSSSYQNYKGGAYWGEDGQAANQHYTPYSDRSHNYNYYRGEESGSGY